MCGMWKWAFTRICPFLTVKVQLIGRYILPSRPKELCLYFIGREAFLVQYIFDNFSFCFVTRGLLYLLISTMSVRAFFWVLPSVPSKNVTAVSRSIDMQVCLFRGYSHVLRRGNVAKKALSVYITFSARHFHLSKIDQREKILGFLLRRSYLPLCILFDRKKPGIFEELGLLHAHVSAARFGPRSFVIPCGNRSLMTGWCGMTSLPLLHFIGTSCPISPPHSKFDTGITPASKGVIFPTDGSSEHKNLGPHIFFNERRALF